ncbi:MAG: GAF domain-containing protein [Anaerolineae bacterium]|nr:GAF domain-containing protein [Anaerolineae bacterium]
MNTIVNQLQESFQYYHVQIYLWDEEEKNLRLKGGTGEPGRSMLARHHQIAAGRGLVGRAAESNQVILVSDTISDPSWLPNPLLPDTRSEAAVPISIGDDVLGVLDVQHDHTNALLEDDVQLLQAIANQIAVAIQTQRPMREPNRKPANKRS